MAASERQVQVQRFDELQIGMVVVLRACCTCGANHRLFLLSYHPHASAYDACTERLYEDVPIFGCAENVHGRRFGIAPVAVQEKRVYRVVDGLDARQERFNSRVLEAVAAGRTRKPHT